jgi:hypothetical protein
MHAVEWLRKMKPAAFLFACLAWGCAASASPTDFPSATPATTGEPAVPPESRDAAVGFEPPLVNSPGTECPNHFWRASSTCLPSDFSEAGAEKEREFYDEVETRVVEEFNSIYGGSFLRGYHVDVWDKSEAARAHIRRMSNELDFFVNQCRAPDVTVRALVQQQSMLERFRTELTNARPIPDPVAARSPSAQQVQIRVETIWSRWREFTLRSTARTILMLRQEALTIANQYHVGGINVPSPGETTISMRFPPSTHSWDKTPRLGCSREAREAP